MVSTRLYTTIARGVATTEGAKAMPKPPGVSGGQDIRIFPGKRQSVKRAHYPGLCAVSPAQNVLDEHPGLPDGFLSFGKLVGKKLPAVEHSLP